MIEIHPPPADALRVAAKECVSNHSADVVADDVQELQFERQHELINVLCHIGGVITALRRCRAAYATQIGRDDCEPLRQSRHDCVILKPVLWKPMDQDERRTLASVNIGKSDPIQVANSLANPSGIFSADMCVLQCLHGIPFASETRGASVGQ